MLGANEQRQRNWLALNIGPSQGVGWGSGIWSDIPPDGGKGIIYGIPAASQGGPFDVGPALGRRRVGQDADGNQINVLGLQTGTNFRILGSTAYDGPLDFEQQPYPPVKDSGVPQVVHLQYDFGFSKWRMWTRDFWVNPTVTDEPPDSPPTPTPKPKPPPPTPTPKPSPDGPGSLKSISASFSGSPGRGRASTWAEASMPSMVFAPQLMKAGEFDYRGWTDPTNEWVDYRNAVTPLTARLESFGAQGGSAGDYLGTTAGWVHTNPRGVYAPGGTANGGLILLPPEVDMSDVDSDFAPDGVNLSSVTLIAGPGTSFGAGLPDLSTGGVRSGYSIARESSGALIFRSHDSSGTSTDRVRLTTAGELNVLALAASWPMPVNLTTDRTFDADSTSVAELADVLGTLIEDLKTTGILTP